jgi:hypothetical protein
VVRKYKTKDHKTLSKWWDGWKWPSVPQESLPPLGLMVDECACGFIYELECNIALVEWIVADPEVPKERRKAALDRLMEEIEAECKHMGYRLMFTMVKQTSLLKKLKDHGFFETDNGMTHLMKLI